MKTIPLLLSFVLLTFAPKVYAQAALPDLSADVRLLHGEREMGKGKLYMSGHAVRMEMKMTGMAATITNINRIDKNVLWTLLPNKTYMEQPLPFDPIYKKELPAGWSQDCSDGGLIDNHPTEKCRVSGTVDGKAHATTIWKAKDLGGVVIQNMGDTGFGMKLVNIAAGAQPASLFEPPADYKRMDLPAAK